MELLASVHYIINDNGCNIEPEFILDVIKSLKAESGFTLKDIKKSILKLKEYKLSNLVTLLMVDKIPELTNKFLGLFVP